MKPDRVRAGKVKTPAPSLPHPGSIMDTYLHLIPKHCFWQLRVLEPSSCGPAPLVPGEHATLAKLRSLRDHRELCLRCSCFSLDLLSEEKSSLSVIKCLVVKSVQDSSKWLFPTLPSAGLPQLTVSSLDDLLAQAKTALRYPVIMQGTSACECGPNSHI